ncbi:MAG: 5'-methylthioadenosine/S-adenosylhomocysteine nucleosidase [Tissierellia bacterium]|jgi:adenosylhomocysteine nucleosidase|nr:5'-methylthioadenosine/S-adenosylhomocysteine nucleosidase [Tissierellia bacterium]
MSNSLIAVLGPNPEELMDFIEQLEQPITEEQIGLTVHRGRYADKDIVAVITGICKVNPAIVTQMLIDRYDISQVIVCGVAGAIADYDIGDTIVSTEVCHHDVVPRFLQEGYPFMDSEDSCFAADPDMIATMKQAAVNFPHKVEFGRIASGEYFVDRAGRQQIIEQFDPLAVDMETAGVAHACYVNRKPFLAIRTITDNEKQSGIDVFRENFETARIRAMELLRRYLEV